MFIDDYFSEANGRISFTRQQGSDFAKRLADDFNPLHDVDAKRFCVPGDLLFSIILARYGLSRHMAFTFSGMVVDGVELLLPEPGDKLVFKDDDDRQYLTAERSGDNSQDETLIQNLTRSYVEFSGHTFPHILVPLLAEQGLMINPERPMVIYESMEIDLDTLQISDPRLETDHNELDMDGKRGNVLLAFNLLDDGAVVGRGCKRMVLGGLRDYDASTVEQAIEAFNRRKTDFPG
jgi:hypothetical protein